MAKRVLLSLTVFFLICVLALLYINAFVLPSKLKSIITDKITETTGRAAVIDSIHFSLLKGFKLDGLTIFDKDLSKPPFLKIEQLNFNVLYLSILKEKKIIIPSLNIQNPNITLIRQTNNTWNISDIIEKKIQPKTTQSPFSFLIGNLNINGAKLTFVDETLVSKFSETFQNINLKARFSLPVSVKFDMNASFSSLPTLSLLSFKGDFNLMTKKLSSQIHLQDIDITKYLNPYYTIKNMIFDKGKISTADIDVQFENKTLNLKSTVNTKDVRVKFLPDKEFLGDPSFELSLTYNPNQQNSLQYTGSIKPNLSVLTGLPQVQSAKDIDGKIFFDTKGLKTDNLTFLIFDQKIQALGTVSDFQNPSLDIRFSSLNTDFKKIKNIFPKIFEKNKIEATGTCDLDVTIKGPTSSLSDLAIEGTATINNANLKTKELPKELTGINGKVAYQKNKIALQDISAVFCDAKLGLSGVITDLENPTIDMDIKSQSLDLDKLAKAFPRILKKGNIEEIAGQASLVAKYKGPMSSLTEGDWQATVFLNNASIAVEGLTEKINSVNGKIIASLNTLSWENLKGIFKNIAYTSDGKLQDFKEPTVQATLTSQNLFLNTKFKKLKDALHINSCEGKYFNSSFRLQGDVDLSDTEEPILDMTVTTNLDLNDIGKIAPPLAEQMRSLDPNGMCTFQGTINGPLKDWHNLTISLNATSPQLSLHGYHFQNAELKLAQENKEVRQCDLTADFYDGKLTVNSTVDLSSGELPYLSNINLEKINLAKLRSDTIWKDKNISGNLSFVFNAKGTLKNLKDMEGHGAILINDGRIWQLNLFQGLGQFLFIPEFENIIFSEAKGELFVKDERISASDFQLVSQPVTLDGAGWIDFKGNIDFDIISEFSENTIAQSDSLKKALTSILTQGDAYLTIKITGSLKEPKYKFSPTGVLKKTTNLLLESIKGVFQ